MRISQAFKNGKADATSDLAALNERVNSKEEIIRDLTHRLSTSEETNQELQNENSTHQSKLTELQTTLAAERKSIEEKIKILDDAQGKLSNSFKALAQDALAQNQETFANLAKLQMEKIQDGAKGELDARQKAIESLVNPINESLKKVDTHVTEIEKSRKEAYGSITEQVKMLSDTQEKLYAETANLVTALRAPSVRGRWGEIQLRNVVEMAGMLSHCDFVEQESVDTDQGKLRPDMIVKLPGGKNVVVDSKTPLKAYLESLEAKDEESRMERLKAHAAQVKTHMNQLSAKAYWNQFDSTPEFVVMFLPGETFFSAALQVSPELIEEGVSQKVILATPTTLIALLRAISYGWQQEKLAENAQHVSDLGKELYDRLRIFADHLQKAGRGINQAVDNYNRAVSSLETRVLPSAKKFTELGISTKEEIPELPPVERKARSLSLGEPEKEVLSVELGVKTDNEEIVKEQS
ncbi:MAG: DNA recombination protein RmuC [Candidatus Lindowbacteria bacterium]|nr:DNA recombination protein RmuC [Candidatus Lindowbacteria bacterium]